MNELGPPFVWAGAARSAGGGIDHCGRFVDGYGDVIGSTSLRLARGRLACVVVHLEVIRVGRTQWLTIGAAIGAQHMPEYKHSISFLKIHYTTILTGFGGPRASDRCATLECCDGRVIWVEARRAGRFGCRLTYW